MLSRLALRLTSTAFSLILLILASVLVANPASAAATYTFYVPGTAVGQTAPGVARDFTLNLTNLNSTVAISFNLSVVASPQGWTAQLSQSSLTVGAGATRQVTLSVIPPSTSLADAVGQFVNVTATPDDNTTAQTVSTTTRVTEVLGVTVNLIPQAGTSGNPGQNITWLGYLKNTGNSAQTYTVTVNNTSYTSTNLTTNLVTVSPGDTRVILVTINISATAPVGTLYSRIMATSNANASISDALTFSASVNPKRVVVLSGLTPDDLVGLTEPEASITFRNIIVENRGNVADSYTLQGSANASRHGDWVSFESTSVSLAAFAQRYLNITVTVPASVVGTGTYTAEFRIVSDNSTSVIAFLNLTLEVQPKHDLLMVYESLVAKQSGDPGTTVSFPVNVSNPGAYDQRVDLTYAGPNSGWVSISASPFVLSPSGYKIVYANFSIPGTETPSQFNFQIKGSINWSNPYRNRTVDLTLEVRQVYDTIASSTATAGAALPGASVAFTVRVHNNGTGLDNFTVSATNATQIGSLSFSSATVALAAGASQNVTVTVVITSLPPPSTGTYYYAITARSSGNVSRVSTVNLAVTVLQLYALTATVSPSYQAADPGTAASYTVSVVNNGNGPDAVTLQKAGINQTWLSIPVGSGTIAPGARMNFTVVATAPSWSPVGATVLTVKVESDGNASVSSSPTFTLALNSLYQATVTAAGTGIPNAHRNTNYTMAVTLRNSGNEPDTYTVTVTGADAAWASIPSPTYALDPNENVTFSVTIRTPAEPDNGAHTFVVDATSLANASHVAMDSFTVTINDILRPEVRLTQSAYFAQPFTTVNILYNLKNNGTLSDGLELLAIAHFPSAQYLNRTTTTLLSGASVNGTFAVSVSHPFSGTYLVEFRLRSLSNSTIEAWAFANITLEVIRLVDVTAAADTAQGGPGDLFNFTLTVRNIGNITDTYTMGSTPPSADWTMTFSQTVITLAPNASVNLTVFVQAPSSLAAGTYNLQAGATSQNVTLLRDLVVLRVSVTYIVSLQATSTSASLGPGDSRTFDLVVLNQGSADDAFALSPSGQVASWVTILPSTVSIAGGGSSTVQVTVTVPVSEHEGARSFAVRAASLGSSVQSSAQSFAITVNQVFSFNASGPAEPLPVSPGQSGTFVLSLTNTGNGNDSYRFVATPSQYVTFSRDNVTLDALASITVSVIFSPPLGASAGTQPLRISIFGGGSGAADVFLTATVLPAFNITARAVPSGELTAAGGPGQTVSLSFEIANRGNSIDTAEWSVIGNASGWAIVRTGSYVLAGGSSVPVTLDFLIPSDLLEARAGSHEFQVLVQSVAGGSASQRLLNGTIHVTAVISIAFSPWPDFSETNLTVRVDREATGDLVYLLYVKNTGNRDETVSFRSSASLGWAVSIAAGNGTATTLALAPGASGFASVRVTRFPVASNGDTIKLTATVADRAIPPRDATITIDFDVADVDVVDASVAVAPLAIKAGETVVVTFTVRNSGAGTARNVQVELVANGVQVDQTTITTIAPGDSKQVTLQWTPSDSYAAGPGQLTVGIVGGGSVPASEVQVTPVSKTLTQRLTGDSWVLALYLVLLVLGIVIGLALRGGRRSKDVVVAVVPAASGDAQGDELAGLAALEAESGAGGAPAMPVAAPSGTEHKVACPNCNTEQWITGSEGECTSCGVIIEVAVDDEPAADPSN